MNLKKPTYLALLNLLLVICIFLNINLNANTLNYDISFRQELLVPQTASVNDNCGKVYSLFTYQPQSSLSFSIIGGASQSFTINSGTGEVYVKQTLTSGVKTIYVRTEDGSSYYDIDTITINVVPTSKCIFINPSYSGTSDGTFSRPYSGWNNVEGNMQKGYGYFQCRGTVYTGPGLDIYNDATNESDKIMVGAYGKGERPIMDGSNLDNDAAIAIGYWHEPASYVEIYSFIIRNCNGIESTPGSNHFKIANCEVYNCINNGNVYLRNDPDDYAKKLDIVIKNIVCYGGTSHGIKLQASGCYAINCKTYNNGITGFKFALESSYNEAEHICSYGNSSNGVTLDGDYCTFKNSVLYNNTIAGINMSSNSINTKVINCTSNNNRYGIILKHECDGHLIKNCEFYDNSRGIRILDKSNNITVHGCISYSNDEYGLIIDNSGEMDGPPTNVDISYNLFYDNTTDEVYLHGINGAEWINNTIFPNSFTVTSTSDNNNIRLTNNIVHDINGNYTNNNNLITQNTGIFVNYSLRNFRLMANATSAIDKGSSHDIDEDLDGHFVPYNNAPDMGCYEYYFDDGQFEAPEAPSNLTGNALTYKSIRLTWNDNSAFETEFVIHRSIGNGVFVLLAELGPNQRIYTDNSALESTTYRYRVYARNPYGSSAYSNIVQVTTPANGSSNPPAAPAVLKTDIVTDSLVTLSWTDQSTIENSFTIQRSTGTNGDFSTIGTTGINITTFNDNSITPGSIYRYRVFASNENGNSDFSNTILVIIPEINNDQLIAPTNLSIIDHDYDYIQLSWSDNANNEDEYILQKTTSLDNFGTSLILPMNTTSYTDEEIEPGNIYYYRLNARNESGTSAYSDTIEVIISELSANSPLEPTSLEVAGISSDAVSFTWSDNSSNEDGFYIYKKRGHETYTLYDTVGVDVNNYLDYFVDYGITYHYKIKAFNEYGTSRYSNQIAPVVVPIPSCPEKLKYIELTFKSVQLYWFDNSEFEDNFIIERSIGASNDYESIGSTSKDSTTYLDEDLILGETYYYRVRSRNIAGLSEPSDSVEVTIPPYFTSQREREGIIAEYVFGKNYYNTVKDISGFKEPLNLEITDMGRHAKGELSANSDTRIGIVSVTNATKIVEECKKTNEITVECWIKPDIDEFASKSTILSIGKNNDSIAFLLGQQLTNYNHPKYRFYSQTTTTSTVPDGYPILHTQIEFDYSTVHHIVYTRDTSGYEYFYLNGILLCESYRPSGFENWEEDFKLSVANSMEMDSRWQGDLYYLAIFSSFTDEETVLYNYSIGPFDKQIDVNEVIEYEITASPNPTVGLVNLQVEPLSENEFSERMVIIVTDILGNDIFEKVIGNSSEPFSQQLDLSHLGPGSYFITLFQNDAVVAYTKIIKLK